jgi:ATP-dependent RNA helicase DeaD
MSDFKSLGLNAPILEALEKMGFEKPSDIQTKAIPMLISEDQRDFVGLAQTGTGKTAAFGLPLLHMLDPDSKATQALIISPTRELTQQIATQLEKFAVNMKRVHMTCVYGGASIQDQMRSLKKNPQIIVATPGRLMDLMKRKAIKLDNIKYVVLDEADEMLNMGFKEDIDHILSFTPDSKKTWLFSATMKGEIKRIAQRYMTNPNEVAIDSKSVVNKNISHQYIICKASDKTEALKRILDLDSEMRTIIFCRTKRGTQDLASDLFKHGYHAEALHGDLSQQQRTRAMGRFKKHELQILVCTDVAARGIDVDDITHVVHYNLPDDSEYYTHRSGRTARAGKKGISLTLATRGDVRKIKTLERSLKIEFETKLVPALVQIKKHRMEIWLNQIKDIEILPTATEDLLSHANETLAEVSKEDLIAKLMSIELQKLNQKAKGTRDLNEEAGSGGRDDSRGERRGRDRDRGDRRDRDRGDRNDRGDRRAGTSERPEREARAPRNETKDGSSRFFINIGSMDGVNVKELTDFICDQAKVPHTDVSNFSLNDKFAHFDITDDHSAKISNSFKGLFVNDREIRANRENENGATGRKPRKDGRGGGGGSDRRSSGGRDGGRSGGRDGGRDGKRKSGGDRSYGKSSSRSSSGGGGDRKRRRS